MRFHMARVDAAIEEAMEGEQAIPSRCCGASFGGAASPDQDWGTVASPAQAADGSIDAAVLQQIVNGVRRSQQSGPQPWWLAAADGAPACNAGQQRASKHARCGSGEPDFLLAKPLPAVGKTCSGAHV